MTTGPFDTVLVANRGEIAVRVLRSAADAGYRTVAVYSDADVDAPHVAAADDAVRLGPAPARDSYLDIDRVVEAAKRSGAQAVHPGYGFLAENADFAEACADAGLTFVGPPASAIRLMGDKAAAKRRMADAGVPLLPGYEGDEQSDDRLLTEAESLGFPLMVKAAAGGGGKGMRLVESPAALPGAIAAARREAAAAFGSDALILERALRRPRHVEIQVLADAHGHVVALGERDCSVQRRHQKVIEEAPSPALDPVTRAAMQDAAVAAARDIGYVGAGTVEFLFDRDLGDEDADRPPFAFLEMNTRLQVEHPVTELVTGIDLVDWQLRIAAGDELTLRQEDVRLDGHAIEARLYAEDPAVGYLPQTGTILAWDPPTAPGIRVDAGVTAGSEVTAHYDPMLAKVIAHGRDRGEAARRLAEALDRLVCLGVVTNRTFLARIVRHPAFLDGEATTAFLDEHGVGPPSPAGADLAAVAGWRHLRRRREAERRSPGLPGWTNAPWRRAVQQLRLRGGDVRDAVSDVEVAADGRGVSVTVDGATIPVAEKGDGRLVVDGRPVDASFVEDGRGRTFARLPHLDLQVTDALSAPPTASGSVGAGVLTAPMHGAVVSVAAAAGDAVEPGAPLVTVEAMKMEHVVRADVAGTVREVVDVGAQVADGDVVARIEPAGSRPAESGDPDGDQAPVTG